jgi:hypothetical protein
MRIRKHWPCPDSQRALKRVRRLMPAACLALIAGCGGGAGDGGQTAVPPPSDTVPPAVIQPPASPPPSDPAPPSPAPPAPEPPPPEPPPGESAPPGGDADPGVVTSGWVPPELPDSDGDGIPDHLDLYPLEEPTLAAAGTARPMLLDAAWTEVEGRPVADVVLAGEPLLLQGRGFQDGGPGSWVVFHTRAGKVAVAPEALAPGLWRVSPPALVLSAHVVVGNERSESRELHYVEPGAPLLFGNPNTAHAGTTFVLEGRSLGGVTHAWLGATPVQVTRVGGYSIELELPEWSDGNLLRVQAGDQESNRLALDFRREVTLRIAPGLPLATGDVLRGYAFGQPFLLAAGDSLQVPVPAHQPMLMPLDIVRAGGAASNAVLGVVIWPDARTAEVSLDSTLQADLLRTWAALPAGGSAAWPVRRDALDAILDHPLAVDYRGGLTAETRDGSAFQRDVLHGALFGVLDAMLAGRADGGGDAPVATLSAGFEAFSAVNAGFEAFSAVDDGFEAVSLLWGGRGPNIRGHSLDSMVIFTVALDSSGKPDTAGGTYAQYTVAPVWAGSCDLSAQVAPDGLTPGDLCVKNGTVLHGSAAVYMPPFFTRRGGYRPRSQDRVRSHVSRVLDEKAFKSSSIYLVDDQGRPLCGMRPCFVEMLTGGLGVGYKVTELSPQDQAVIGLLRRRWLVETFVIGQMAALFGINSDAGVASCFAASVLEDVAFARAVTDFVEKARKDPPLARVSFDETVGVYISNTLSGAVSGTGATNKLYACAVQVLAVPIEALEARVLDNLNKKTRLISGVRAFLAVLEGTMTVGGVAFTPEKFLFKVLPRAEITENSPLGIDLYDTVTLSGNPRMLRIIGDWLANPVAADGVEAFMPALVFRDQRGETRRFTVDPSQVVVGQDPVRELRLPLPWLGFIDPANPVRSQSLSGLEGNKLDFWLEYSHLDFVGYPGRVLRVPSIRPIDFAPQARITAFDPPGAPAGSEVRASGGRLGDFRDRPRVTFIPRGGGSPRSTSAAEIRGRDLFFTVPLGLAAGAYQVELTEGTGYFGAVLAEVDFQASATLSPSITLADFGQPDDTLVLRLLNASGQVVHQIEVPDAQTGYRKTLSWSLSSGVSTAEVECVFSAADETCTWSLALRNAQLRLDPGPGDPQGQVQLLGELSGQLRVGQKLEFALLY